MGFSAKDKNIKFTRRAKSAKSIPKFDQLLMAERALMSNSIVEVTVEKFSKHLGGGGKNPNPNFGSSNNNWGYCSEDEIAMILISYLDFVFNETVCEFVRLGYSGREAMRAVLKNGGYFCGMDLWNDMRDKCLEYLRRGDDGIYGSEIEFDNLRQLEEVSLASMIAAVLQARPNTSKGDAMWCLLMSDLHVDRASKMELPVVSSPGKGYDMSNLSFRDGDKISKFHGGWFENNRRDGVSIKGLPPCDNDAIEQGEYEFPERYNLTPAMKSSLKRNAAMIAARFRANSKEIRKPSEGSTGSKSNAEVPVNDKNEEDSTNELICSVLGKFRELNLKENQEFVYEDHQDRLLLTLIHQIKVVEKKVKDVKEWADETAIQVARKLCNDLTELRKLRLKRDETQRQMNVRHVLDDSILKKYTELEDALKKASSQADRATAVVQCLESENKELKADMEASKLSRSESITTCLEVAKKEQKCLKRVLACEKQKTKFQEEIATEKKKIEDLQQHLVRIELADKEAEVKWRTKQKAKEQALERVIEEQGLTKLSEANCKRRLGDLNLDIERDFQRHKDDKQRLELEFSQLQASIADSAGVPHSSKTTRPNTKADVAAINPSLDEIDDTKCIFCSREEVGVLFIPCAHVVLCCKCNDGYGKKGKATCPCCRVPIQQRVRIFGPSA